MHRIVPIAALQEIGLAVENWFGLDQHAALPRIASLNMIPTQGKARHEALINEWAAKGSSLHQAVRESTYWWVLVFSSTVLHLCDG
ncbi:hypothetical protein GOD62_32625 [Sinorhizobium medicae]|nr:hypothetical protein [Sinorhizobium medicae]MDX1109238.1 hypothetical protein [Sinorhizobium medicae]